MRDREGRGGRVGTGEGKGGRIGGETEKHEGAKWREEEAGAGGELGDDYGAGRVR